MVRIFILNLNFTMRIHHKSKIIIAKRNYNMSDRGDDEEGEGEDFSSKQQGDAASCESGGVLEQPTVRRFHGFEHVEHSLP